MSKRLWLIISGSNRIVPYSFWQLNFWKNKMTGNIPVLSTRFMEYRNNYEAKSYIQEVSLLNWLGVKKTWSTWVILIMNHISYQWCSLIWNCIISGLVNVLSYDFNLYKNKTSLNQFKPIQNLKTPKSVLFKVYGSRNRTFWYF